MLKIETSNDMIIQSRRLQTGQHNTGEYERARNFFSELIVPADHNADRAIIIANCVKSRLNLAVLLCISLGHICARENTGCLRSVSAFLISDRAW